MRLRVHGRNIIATEALHQHIERQFDSALDRVEHEVHSVMLRLKDFSGTRRGADKGVHVSVELTDGQKLFIEDHDRDLYHVISRAAGRAKFVVREHLKRRRSRRRAA